MKIISLTLKGPCVVSLKYSGISHSSSSKCLVVTVLTVCQRHQWFVLQGYQQTIRKVFGNVLIYPGHCLQKSRHLNISLKIFHLLFETLNFEFSWTKVVIGVLLYHSGQLGGVRSKYCAASVRNKTQNYNI